MKDSQKIALGRRIAKVPAWAFLVLAAPLLYIVLGEGECSADFKNCGLLIAAVAGLAALSAGFALRAWLAARERGIAALSQLRFDIGRSSETMLALRQSQSDLLESLPEPVMVLDESLRITHANGSARGLFGNKLSGKSLPAALRDPDLLAACAETLAVGGEGGAEFKQATPVERVFQARIKSLPLSASEEQGTRPALLLSLHDITPIRKTEQMRADFVANVSHEMRTPLASLIGFIETLQGPAQGDAAAQKNFLKIMEGQAKNMARLVEDLLSLSRIEMREHTQPEEEVEVEPLLNNIAIALQMQLQEKSMRIVIDCAENIPSARGDADELFQVLMNLVTNAIRYGRAGTPILITADLTYDPPARFPQGEQGAIAISVTDQGVGIPAAHIPRLTERFYRVDKARSREVGGTGLGLAIVKHIVNRHRGALVIESQEGVGSRFTVYLPVVG